MKTRAIALIAGLALAGVAQAGTPTIEGLLIPASPECFVTVTLTGTLSQLNALGGGDIKYGDDGRITKIGSATIAYDNSGRIKKIGSSTFEYDDSGRIRKIAGSSILYDDSGRIKKVGVSNISYDDTGRVDKINPAISASI